MEGICKPNQGSIFEMTKWHKTNLLTLRINLDTPHMKVPTPMVGKTHVSDIALGLKRIIKVWRCLKAEALPNKIFTARCRSFCELQQCCFVYILCYIKLSVCLWKTVFCQLYQLQLCMSPCDILSAKQKREHQCVHVDSLMLTLHRLLLLHAF